MVGYYDGLVIRVDYVIFNFNNLTVYREERFFCHFEYQVTVDDIIITI